MKELYLEIGLRLKEIRQKIFFEGIKLTAGQFAKLIDSTVDKIRNYETGRSAVPVELLIELYKGGIHPAYILTGEGSKYADNEEGKKLKLKIEGRTVMKGDVANIYKLDSKKMSADELLNIINVAAGDIKKMLGEKKKRK